MAWAETPRASRSVRQNIRSSESHRHTGGRRGQSWGCSPTPPEPPKAPSGPAEPSAARTAGTSSRRLFWKSSRLFPSCLPPLRQLPGHTSSLSRDETGLSSTYFPAPHSPRCNFTPRCPHLRGASAAPKGWRGDGERGGCGWTDRFEFSFPALLISCHANPDTGKSLDHAERLRVCVCGCVLGEGANRQGFTRGAGEGKQADVLARRGCQGLGGSTVHPCAPRAAPVGASTSCRSVGGRALRTRVCEVRVRVDTHACAWWGDAPPGLGSPGTRLGRKGLSCPKKAPRASRDGAKGTAWVSLWGCGFEREVSKGGTRCARPCGCPQGRGRRADVRGSLSSRWELGRLPAPRTGERCQPASRVVPGLRPPPARQRRRRQELPSEPALQTPPEQVPGASPQKTGCGHQGGVGSKSRCRCSVRPRLGDRGEGLPGPGFWGE